MRPALLALVVLALVPAGEARAFDGSRSRTRRANNRCYAVRVEAVRASAEPTRHRRRYRRRFVAHELLDLEMSVWLPAKSEASLVEIHVYTPAGRLYDVLQARAGAGGGETTRYRGRRSRVMSARLPVAGSHITSRSLYGTWRAEVFVDGDEDRCTRRAKTFTIAP